MWPQAMFGEWKPLPAMPGLDGIYLAQVLGVSAPDHTVDVILPDLGALIGGVVGHGCKAHVLEHRASRLAGEVSLPRAGDWGVVVFPGGSSDLAVWLGSLYQNAANICTEAPDTHLSQYEDGSWLRIKADGTVEFAHPSGTFIRMGTGTALGTRTRRERQGAQSREVSHTIPSNPPVTLNVEHSSGARITIAPDGEVTIAAASGKLLHLAGTVGEDFIALKAGLEKVQADLNIHIGWAQGHVHGGVQGGLSNTGAPNVAPTPSSALLAETHYTGQAKAT